MSNKTKGPRWVPSDRDLRLLRVALLEAILEVTTLAESNLQQDTTRDTPHERKMRRLCAQRVKRFEKMLARLGGELEGEMTMFDVWIPDL